MLPRFYWLIDGVLAGCSRPGASERRGPSAEQGPAGEALDRDLTWLRGQGIRAVLSLTETPLSPDVVDRHGLHVLHLPIPDLHAPTPDQFMRALSFVDRQRAAGRAVVVHCLVGQGRTGTILAAYRIRGGAPPEQALHEIRTICPGAVGSAEQEQALHRFAARCDWIL
jgi:atypical dual specificity phosphatase